MFTAQILVLFIFLLLIQESLGAALPRHSTHNVSITRPTKTHHVSQQSIPENLIIFLAKPDRKCFYSIDQMDESGIEFLKFPIRGELQPCPLLNDDATLPEPLMRVFRVNRNSCYCEDMLKMNLMALIDWAQNKMHMTTAIITTDGSFSKENRDRKIFTNDIGSTIFQEGIEARNLPVSKHQQNSMMYQREVPVSRSESIVEDKDMFEQLPLKPRKGFSNNDLPGLEYGNRKDGDLLIINAFNPKEKKKTNFKLLNDIEDLPPVIHFHENRPANPTGVCSIKSNISKDLETGSDTLHKNVVPYKPSNPENEIKCNETAEKKSSEALMYSDDSDQDPEEREEMWNFYGLFSKLKNAFLESYFNPNPQKRSVPDYPAENLVNTDVIGTVEDVSYFELVRMTLLKLKEQKKTRSIWKGYSMMVVAGNLSEISDPFSKFVQSVKNVIENTDENSLVVVSGSCPDRAYRKRKVPFYVKGKNSDMLASSQNLQDLFENIHKAFNPVEAAAVIRNKHPVKREKFNTDFKSDEPINILLYKKSYNDWLNDLSTGKVLEGRSRLVRSTSKTSRTLNKPATSGVVLTVALSIYSFINNFQRHVKFLLI